MTDQLLKAFIQHSQVLITPHQAFLTKEALQVIAEKTLLNLDMWKVGKVYRPLPKIVISSNS